MTPGPYTIDKHEYLYTATPVSFILFEVQGDELIVVYVIGARTFR